MVYERSGHVFQDRFKSECVEDDAYLLTVIRYIHQNPLEAKIVEEPEKYKWSSCRAYYEEKENPPFLTQTQLILQILSLEEVKARKQFRQHIKEQTDDGCLDDSGRVRISDEKVRGEISSLLQGKPISAIQQMEKADRNEILRNIKEVEGASLRQIAKDRQIVWKSKLK